MLSPEKKLKQFEYIKNKLKPNSTIDLEKNGKQFSWFSKLFPWFIQFSARF